MSIAMLMSMASCSSSDDEMEEIKEESKLVPMTFTATQESNVVTRSALNGSNGVVWQTGDKISVFDFTGNHEFTLTDNVAEGKFSGTVSSEAYYFSAVYPYTEGVQSTPFGYNGITLPAVQTAYKDSFDPKAALMMAYTEGWSQLNFKNAVSLVKVTTQFACKKIVLTANENIAGTGELCYNDGEPSITFRSYKSKTVTLKPASEDDVIAPGTYYIAICPHESTGFSISFINSDDTKAYTRTSTKNITIHRREIKNLGTFSESGTSWTSTMVSHGNVKASQQVDMGVFTIGDKNYRVIFATSNLTTAGLAENEYDYGDYFAWGATAPWYSSFSGDTFTWEDGKSGGYSQANAPFYNSSTREYTKYTAGNGNTLEASDDVANVILHGDWQIPTTEIWQALNTSSYTKTGKTKNGKDGWEITNNSTNNSIFLPAAGYVYDTNFSSGGSRGGYWSRTAATVFYAYSLYFTSRSVNVEKYERYYGFSVRPVRLVEVPLAGSGETEILDDKGDPFSNNY